MNRPTGHSGEAIVGAGIEMASVARPPELPASPRCPPTRPPVQGRHVANCRPATTGPSGKQSRVQCGTGPRKRCRFRWPSTPTPSDHDQRNTRLSPALPPPSPHRSLALLPPDGFAQAICTPLNSLSCARKVLPRTQTIPARCKGTPRQGEGPLAKHDQAQPTNPASQDLPEPREGQPARELGHRLLSTPARPARHACLIRCRPLRGPFLKRRQRHRRHGTTGTLSPDGRGAPGGGTLQGPTVARVRTRVGRTGGQGFSRAGLENVLFDEAMATSMQGGGGAVRHVKLDLSNGRPPPVLWGCSRGQALPVSRPGGCPGRPPNAESLEAANTNKHLLRKRVLEGDFWIGGSVSNCAEGSSGRGQGLGRWRELQASMPVPRQARHVGPLPLGPPRGASPTPPRQLILPDGSPPGVPAGPGCVPSTKACLAGLA